MLHFTPWPRTTKRQTVRFDSVAACSIHALSEDNSYQFSHHIDDAIAQGIESQLHHHITDFNTHLLADYARILITYDRTTAPMDSFHLLFSQYIKTDTPAYPAAIRTTEPSLSARETISTLTLRKLRHPEHLRP